MTVYNIDCGRTLSTWTDPEREVLRQHYRSGGAKAVAERLPDKAIWSIYREADRLDLTCKRTAYWADSLHAATMLGLMALSADTSDREKATTFFAERRVTLRRNAKGKSAVLLVSLAQWLATNPPEFDLKLVDQAWFVTRMLRS